MEGLNNDACVRWERNKRNCKFSEKYFITTIIYKVSKNVIYWGNIPRTRTTSLCSNTMSLCPKNNVSVSREQRLCVRRTTSLCPESNVSVSREQRLCVQRATSLCPENNVSVSREQHLCVQRTTSLCPNISQPSHRTVNVLMEHTAWWPPEGEKRQVEDAWMVC